MLQELLSPSLEDGGMGRPMTSTETPVDPDPARILGLTSPRFSPPTPPKRKDGSPHSVAGWDGVGSQAGHGGGQSATDNSAQQQVRHEVASSSPAAGVGAQAHDGGGSASHPTLHGSIDQSRGLAETVGKLGGVDRSAEGADARHGSSLSQDRFAPPTSSRAGTGRFSAAFASNPFAAEGAAAGAGGGSAAGGASGWEAGRLGLSDSGGLAAGTSL